jgi:hypothetical protein
MRKSLALLWYRLGEWVFRVDFATVAPSVDG